MNPNLIPTSTASTATTPPASPPDACMQPPTPENGGNETSVPKDAAVLRDDLLARSIALFGQAEVMPYQPSHFPDHFQKLVERLKPACANEIVTVACNATTNLCALIGAFNDIDESQWLFKENPWLTQSACTIWRGILFI